MNEEVEKLVQLGRDSLIQRAVTLMNQDINPKDFATIKVTTDGEDVHVAFLNPIKYLPINSVFYFDAIYSLIYHTGGYNSVANPPDYKIEGEIPFFKETKEIKKNMDFVIDAINRSYEVGSFDRETFDDRMIIREYKKYYDITVVSEYQESMYKIDKRTGEIYDAMHDHLIPPPVFDGEERTIIEIK